MDSTDRDIEKGIYISNNIRILSNSKQSVNFINLMRIG